MSHDAQARRIAENVAEVRGRISVAARRSGRPAESVRLIAVTKYVDAELLPALIAAGCREFGESRPQELWKKAAALEINSPLLPVQWHLIGHLQRNKIERTLPLVSWVHSGDSLRLLAALHEAAARAKRRVPVLLEVNIAEEPTKGGFSAVELPALADELARLPHLDLCGLMAMAAPLGGLEGARRDFARMRRLRDALQSSWAGAFDLAELSMGMSGDYEVAIEEGATMVRVGSALFEGAA